MVHVAAKPTSTASSHPIKLAKLKLSIAHAPGPSIGRDTMRLLVAEAAPGVTRRAGRAMLPA
jgi:hypothetical protein